MATYLKNRIIPKASKADEKLLRKTVEDILDAGKINLVKYGNGSLTAYDEKLKGFSFSLLPPIY